MAESPQSASVEVNYQKSNFFRVIHVDGAFGGPSPRGLVNIAFYSERMPIPKKTEFELNAGTPGVEKAVDVKGGIFREVEANMVMDIAVACSLYVWLGQKIIETGKQIGMSDEIIKRMMGGV